MFVAGSRISREEYYDDFNRANGALGARWLGSAQPTINTNAAQNSTSSGNTPQFTYYDSQLGTDSYSITTTVKLPVGTNRSTTTYTYLIGRCASAADQTGGTSIVLVFAGAAMSSGLYTYNGSALSLISGQTISAAWSAGQTAELRIIENEYSVYHAGALILAWTDTTNLIPRGAGRRGFGFGTQPFNSGIGFAHDDILAKDL